MRGFKSPHLKYISIEVRVVFSHNILYCLVLESLDKKGNDEEFVPWAMGWIKSATGIGARAT